MDIIDELRNAKLGLPYKPEALNLYWRAAAEIEQLRSDVAVLDQAVLELRRERGGLRAALKRIDSINDNPAIYNQDIEDVIQKMFPTEFCGNQQSGRKE